MKQQLPAWAGPTIGTVVALVALGLGFVYFQKATGAPSEDVDLAKKQAAVEHSQFEGKINGAPPDAGAGEMAARQKSGR